MIDLEAGLDGGLFVVPALDSGSSPVTLVLAFNLRRVELNMIGASRRPDAHGAHSCETITVRYRDLQCVVDGNASVFHRLGLRDSPREAIEQVAVLAIRLLPGAL